MKKIEVSQFGGPENLILVNSEIPNPGANQVLIKVAVAGVNFIDVYQCQGLPSYNMKVPLDRKSTRLNSSHSQQSRMPSSA